MKLGDTITVFGPRGALVTGVVVHTQPLKTRSGWSVSLKDPGFQAEVYPLGSFMLRPEDEGVTWIYGEDQKGKDALLVAEALAENTVKMAPRPQLLSSKAYAARKSRKTGTV